ncbi:MAG: argininosuccinate lyase [Burkholderiales bacterium]|nr:argininosuccinate lyase [Burkholderiales bacterium]
MESKLSGFLSEPLAPEIQENLLAPALKRLFPASLPPITAINKAHLVMLARTGIVDAALCRRLAATILELEREGPDAFKLDGALEDAYFNYEAEFNRRLGADVGGYLHVARSRNDIKATQDRMRARDYALRIMQGLLRLRARIHERGALFADVVMPGYTHMQPAQPVTFGYYLLGVAHALERDFQRLGECYARLNQCPMGACALAGTSFPIDRAMTADLLGFDEVMPHAQDAVATRESVIELVGHCALLAGTIGRLAQDFYNMTTHEFSTLHLPDSVAATSSIMPQKKNMAVLECLKGRVAPLTGALVTALAAYKATPYTHMQDGHNEGLRWAWDALEESVAAVTLCQVVVERATPDRERMYALVRANFSTVTDLADLLVKDAGLSFREAHHVIGRVVRLALAQGLTADRISPEHIARAGREILGRAVTLDEAALRDGLDPGRAVERRAGSGSPARSDLTAMLATLSARLDADATRTESRRAKLDAANARLEEAIRSLATGLK